MTVSIGTGIDQIPTNGMLGTLAFQDADQYPFPQKMPTVFPTLNLDFVNSNQVDPRITFVRTTTATYYDGKTTALAEQNLVTQSQTFSTWTLSGATVTANTTTAPDGTTTGTSLIESATTANHNIFFGAGTVGLTYTQTVYAKANTRNWLKVINYVTYANFDLTNGVIGSYNTVGVPTITSVGNGWYRCTMSLTTNLASYMQLSIGSGNVASYNDSYTGDGTSGIYVWGAQLEQRSSATTYTPTTTAAITNYIPQLMTAPAGVPRLDYNPTTGQALGLLIEEARTNLLTYSNVVGGTTWVKSGTTAQLNTAIAPDGTQTASLIIPNLGTNAGGSNIYTQPTLVLGTTYTYSFYAKLYGTFTTIAFFDSRLGTSAWCTFTLTGNGSYVCAGTGLTATITLLPNSWYKCTVTATSTASSTTNSVLYLGGVQPTTGDGYSGIFIWGAQLEAGSFATSYIPTVASAVTRNADQASMTGTNFSSWYNQTQGSFYTDADANLSTSIARGVFAVQDAAVSSANSVSEYYDGNNVSTTYVLTKAGSNISSLGQLTKNNKSAFAYGTNPIIASGGVTSTSTPNTSAMPTLDRLYIGNLAWFSTGYLNGHIRTLRYYPIALSSVNLQGLTL